MDQLTSAQLSEWEAYDRLDPIGSWRDDFRFAYMASLLTNLTISIHGKKETKLSNPMDFMFDWDIEGKEEKEPEKQSVEQMKEILLGFAHRQNKKHKRVANKKPPKVASKKKK